MASKKIRVGVANESLTPSEQHRIEVKLDKMLGVPGAPPVTDGEEVNVAAVPELTAPIIPPAAIVPAAKPEATKPEVHKTQVVKITEERTASEKITVTQKPKPIAIVDNTVDTDTIEVQSLAETPATAPAAVPQLVRVPWREPVSSATQAAADAVEDTDNTAASNSAGVTIGNLDAIPESHIIDDLTPANDATEVDRAAKHAAALRAGEDSDQPKATNIFKRLASGWWRSARWRYGTIALVILLLVAIFAVAQTRATALNLFGLRASVSLTVLDGTTQLPLEGAQVRVGSASAQSGADGKVTLQKVRLGKQTLRVEKLAFAIVQSTKSISLGNNAVGKVALKADGTLYKFSVTDYVSGKAIAATKAVDGEASAIADNRGIIILTLKAPSAGFTVTLTAPGYRKQPVQVAVGKTSVIPVQMVPDSPELYVSNRDGKYGVYAMDIDGKNDTLILAGTGNENDQISLAANASGEEAALISTRDNQKDSGGYVLQALTLINTRTKAATIIDHSQRIQLIDWYGDRLVYAMTKAGASAANPSRYQLMSYNFKTSQRLQLDHANHFNDIVGANGAIYYATSNQYSGGVSEFKKINPDGNGKQTLLVNEVWDIFRTAHDKFALSSPTGWYDYVIDAAKPTATTSAYEGSGLFYQDSPDGKTSVWLDTRDGKSILFAHDTGTQQDSILVSRPNLATPLRWLNKNTVIFRIKSSAETADYAVSLHGGTPKKITDVTNASGIARYSN